MAEKEELLFKKRISELGRLTYQRDIPSYTDFLTLNEQTVFHSIRRELPAVRFIMTGGYETAERKIVCFLASYEEEETAVLPISVIKAEPVSHRFAQELTHRDYLGALMNLGVERSMLGDILMNENGCFIYCLTKMAEYISRELVKVSHTPVRCEIVADPAIIPEPKFEEITGSVASIRLDNLISLAFKTSRTKVIPYIEGEKVFVDGRAVTSAGTRLKEGEIVSVRGLGKFLYAGITNETKKGRFYVTVKKYS